MNYKIATATSRKSLQWHNHEISWRDLKANLSNAVRTHETVKEYQAMSKEAQSRVKDVGGFVGGYLNDGKRKAANVRFRSLLTLDIDHATNVEKTWVAILNALPETAAVLYSTHSHTPEAPRLRLVAPLDRETTPEEYEALARAIAFNVGIEVFDKTTYQPERLMYWPSAPADGEVIFRYYDGGAISVDTILGMYTDWRDVSEWPRATQETEVVRRQLTKAEDPTEKKGIVGAFCRAHTITEVLTEMLADIYEPTRQPNRFTYRNGHVSAGLVVYDDKWTYAHNETDPGCGRLLNAFDLVRLHRFGDRDDGVDLKTPANRWPSYVAMTEFAAQDKPTRRALAVAAAADFEDALAEVDDWEESLDVDRKGNIRSTINNVMKILTNDPEIKGRLHHNLFTGRDEVTGVLPWRSEPGAWNDADDAGLRGWLEAKYSLSGKDKIADAKTNVTVRAAYHPVRDYLDGLSWDGESRVDGLIIDRLGAANTELNRALSRLMLTAAVARIYRPGAKYDLCPILCGPQGSYKSTLIEVLFGDWFSSSLPSLDGKEAMEHLRGLWGVEIAELATLNRSAIESTKAFISKTTDVFRASYARNPQTVPRQCVFFGTTNDDAFLKDSTGNRRFPVIVIDPVLRNSDNVREELIADRDQIWAEAVALYKQDPEVALRLPRHLEELVERIQGEFVESKDDPDIWGLRDYLDTRLPSGWATFTLEQRQRWYEGGTALPDSPAREVGVDERDRVCALGYLLEYKKCRKSDPNMKYEIRRINKLLTPELTERGWDTCAFTVKFGAAVGPQRGYKKNGRGE